ncbi:hypothetical protein [Vibrio sp. 10N.222.52.C12]|uniref:hypothetical protein n=1 Tax=Vibrio sp. 10N.222.52.C12 TaxID=3229630 RepID=UPI00354FFA2A
MKFVESKLIWWLLVVTTILLLKSSDEHTVSFLSGTLVGDFFEQFKYGNTIIFNLCIGYIVSLLFYVLVVLIPEYRKREDLKDQLGYPISFMFEAFFHDRTDFSIVFHWSKHIINCKPINEHLVNLSRFKNDASFKRLKAPKAICLVQSAHEVLPTFEQLVPVAFQVSHRHALIWVSLTNSLRQIASLNDIKVDDRDWDILDLNLSEFVEYVGQFYDAN